MEHVAGTSAASLTWALFIGPVVIAAVVAALVSLVVARINRSALVATNADRIEADRQALERKVSADVDVAL